MMKALKRIFLFGGAVIGAVTIALVIWLHYAGLDAEKQNAIGAVKEYRLNAAERDRAVRIGKSPEKFAQDATMETDVNFKMHFLKKYGRTIEPVVWDAWSQGDNIYLVGAQWVRLDSVGKPVEADGEFFEVRLIGDSKSIRWLSVDADTTGVVKDYLAREYMKEVQVKKDQFMIQWSQPR
jgi:hypothetical protein